MWCCDLMAMPTRLNSNGVISRIGGAKRAARATGFGDAHIETAHAAIFSIVGSKIM
jgi:hypothetical protein